MLASYPCHRSDHDIVIAVLGLDDVAGSSQAVQVTDNSLPESPEVLLEDSVLDPKTDENLSHSSMYFMNVQ